MPLETREIKIGGEEWIRRKSDEHEWTLSYANKESIVKNAYSRATPEAFYIYEYQCQNHKRITIEYCPEYAEGGETCLWYLTEFSDTHQAEEAIKDLIQRSQTTEDPVERLYLFYEDWPSDWDVYQMSLSEIDSILEEENCKTKR